MDIHQLAVFWRDQQARCFTLLHFQPPTAESANFRAKKILSVLEHLSSLHIYGAALDQKAFPFYSQKPVASSGSDKRVEVEILPDAALNPRAGITKIKFSLPAPTQPLALAIENQSFNDPDWLLLEKEVLDFLCLPIGIGVKTSSQYIHRAQILILSAEQRPQSARSPLASAIAATEQDMLEAQQPGRQKTPSPERIEKYKSRLSHLQALQLLEQAFFSAAERTLALSNVATTTDHQDAPARPSREQSAQLPLEVLKQLTPVNASFTIDKEHTSMLDNQNSDSAQHNYLPQLPSQQQPEWKDVPLAHFSDPSFWLNRNQIKQSMALNERSYFRLINKLSPLGLNRSLPSQHDDRVKLFYRMDLQRALEKASSLTQKRGRPTKTLSLPLPQSPQSQPVEVPSQSAQSAVPSAKKQPASDMLSLQAQIASLQAQQQSLKQQHQALESAINRIDSTIANLTLGRLPIIQDQITSLAQQQAAQAEHLHSQLPNSGLVELITQLSNFNQISSLLQQLSSQLKSLPSRLAILSSKTKSTKAKAKAAKKTAKPTPKTKPIKPRSKATTKKEASIKEKQATSKSSS